jgi:RNA polymerase sigma-B factor
MRRTGDPRALDALVKQFLPLARQLARRYYGGGESLEDLVQVASLGLIKAVKRFDESRGVSFSSYAVPTITGELKRYFRDTVWAVHVPRGMQERALAVNQAIVAITEQSGRVPTHRELADRMQLDKQEIRDALGAYDAFDAASLDAPVHGPDDPGQQQPRTETIGSADEGYELVDDRLAVNAAVRTLPTRERRVLHMRFVEDRTQADIAARIGVSQMQVSRILKHILDRLRHSADPEVALARG